MPKAAKINGQIFPRANRQFAFFPENIDEAQKSIFTSADPLFSPKISMKSKKKMVFTSADVLQKQLKGYVLVIETSAAAFSLTRFRDLARVPKKRARVLSPARVPGVAHPCVRLS